MTGQESRRRVLETVGVSAVSLTLAGCQGFLDRSPDEEPTTTGNTTSTSTENSTETPAENETETETPGEDDTEEEPSDQSIEDRLLETNRANEDRFWEIIHYHEDNFTTQFIDLETIAGVAEHMGAEYNHPYFPGSVEEPLGLEDEDLILETYSLPGGEGQMITRQIDKEIDKEFDLKSAKTELDIDFLDNHQDTDIYDNNLGMWVAYEEESNVQIYGKRVDDVKDTIDALKGHKDSMKDGDEFEYPISDWRESSALNDNIVLRFSIADELNGDPLITNSTVQGKLRDEENGSEIVNAIPCEVYNPEEGEITEELYLVTEDGEVTRDGTYGWSISPDDFLFFD